MPVNQLPDHESHRCRSSPMGPSVASMTLDRGGQACSTNMKEEMDTSRRFAFAAGWHSSSPRLPRWWASCWCRRSSVRRTTSPKSRRTRAGSSGERSSSPSGLSREPVLPLRCTRPCGGTITVWPSGRLASGPSRVCSTRHPWSRSRERTTPEPRARATASRLLDPPSEAAHSGQCRWAGDRRSAIWWHSAHSSSADLSHPRERAGWGSGTSLAAVPRRFSTRAAPARPREPTTKRLTGKTTDPGATLTHQGLLA